MSKSYGSTDQSISLNMSTPNNGFPPVSLHLPGQFQNVRLVEVPDEIVDILSRGENLFFKSSPPLTFSGTDKGGNLHLCGNERSWLVKQVSTSNSLYVTQSQASTVNHRRSSDGNENLPNDLNSRDEDMIDVNINTTLTFNYLTAISKPTNVLELYPVSATTQQNIIHEHLVNLIPPINDDLDNFMLREQSQYSCKELLHHIPAPSSLINRALAQECIGDHWQGKAYRPTLSLLLETWKRVVTFAISNSLELDEVLLRDKCSHLQLDDSDDDNQKGVSSIFSSIASTLSKSGGYFEENNLMTTESSSPQLRFKPQDTARWIGNLILLASKDKATEFLTKDTFEAQWEDLVPASWVKFCSVEILLPACIVEKGENGQELLQWAPFQISDDTQTGTETQNGTGREKDVAPKTAATNKNKRKWHEKFAAQRSNAKK